MRYITFDNNKKGHYSPGVLVGNTLYISGQLPIDPATEKLAEGGIREQTRAALENVARVLDAAELKKENVALCRVYIPDVSLWD